MTGALGYTIVHFANNALNVGSFVVLGITLAMCYTIYTLNRRPIAGH